MTRKNKQTNKQKTKKKKKQQNKNFSPNCSKKNSKDTTFADHVYSVFFISKFNIKKWRVTFTDKNKIL